MATSGERIGRLELLVEIEDIERRARDQWKRLETQHGCEAGSARGFENGRINACADLRRALGLPAVDV